MRKSCFVSRIGPAAALAGAGSAWGQVCSYQVDYVAAADTVTSVPSLSTVAVGLLAVAVGFLAWRQGRLPGARFMAATLLAAAALLANHGGLIQKAYAAVVQVVLSDSAGGSIAVTADHGDTLTFQNGSSASLRISSITPAPAACGSGTLLLAGGTCSTTASCALPEFCGVNEVSTPDGCECDQGYTRNDGVCVPH